MSASVGARSPWTMGDATTKEKKKVIVTAYEEVPPPPRRRPPGSGRAGSTSSSTTMTTAEVTTWRQAKAAPAPAPASASASAAHHGVAGARYRGSNRRALLLAYAQHLRRRDQRGAGGGRPRVLLEWGKWKAQGHPGVGAGGNALWQVGRRRSWCYRFRLWTRAFLRRVRRIGENALCKNKEISQPANVG